MKKDAKLLETVERHSEQEVYRTGHGLLGVCAAKNSGSTGHRGIRGVAAVEMGIVKRLGHPAQPSATFQAMARGREPVALHALRGHHLCAPWRRRRRVALRRWSEPLGAAAAEVFMQKVHQAAL